MENLLGVHALALVDRFVSGALGIGSTECAALVTLLAHPGRTVGWLGEVLGMTSSGVTRLVERLVVAGWVVRGAGTDGRHRRLTLTPAGADRAKEVLANREAALGRVVGVLSAEEREQLEALLDKMVAGLADDLPSALRLCRLCDRAACGGIDHKCPLRHTMADE